MPIAREGWPYVLGLLVAASLAWLASVALAAGFAALALFTLFFFRDPDRRVPDGAGLVVSPADGKVVAAEPGRISVFLSIFNVHVNRSPIGGRIETVRYQPGAFRAAFDPRASSDNEQNVVTVRGDGHDVVFKQIAGLIARRIVFWKRPSDPVGRGERVGLIKFGSRVDVFVPEGSALRVAVGDRVRAGESVLAQLPAAERA
jgi:phosphatidylserine decarboxylase